MTRISHNLHQDVTHWSVTGSDGFGGFTFAAPVLLAGRWQEAHELFLTPNNEEVLSNAIVYLENDVDVGDFLALGDYANPLVGPTLTPPEVDGAYRIRQRNKTTDLRNLIALRKAFL
jgi:hypothetical protein